MTKHNLLLAHVKTSYVSIFLLDDIVQADSRPLCAAEIGSELQKRFAILPGG